MKLSKLFRLGAGLLGIRGVRSTYRPTVGPFTFNTSAQTGLSSVSVGAGPARFRVWDRSGNTGLSSVDLPGPISYRPSRGSQNSSQAQETAAENAPLTMNPNGYNTKQT